MNLEVKIKQRVLFWCLFSTLGLLAVQTVFFVVLSSHSNQISHILKESFDVGLYDSDFQNASVLVRSLEKTETLKCFSLKVFGVEQSFIVYESAIKDGCDPIPFFLQGISHTGSLVSKDGNTWVFHYVVPTGFEFTIILWLFRLLVLFVVYYSVRFHFFQKEQAFQREKDLALNMRAVAHDLTSPIGLLRMINESNLNLDEVKKRDFIFKATERLSEIARTILDGTLDVDSFKNASFNLKSSVSEIVKEKSLFFKDDIIITSNILLDRTNCNVLGDQEKFKRILSNLINNSFEAVNTGPLKLDLKTFFDDKSVHLDIADNGSGIPPEILNDLGKSIVRSSKRGGNGLGLFLAKRDLSDWGGDMNIVSSSPHGTTVRLSFKRKTIL